MSYTKILVADFVTTFVVLALLKKSHALVPTPASYHKACGMSSKNRAAHHTAFSFAFSYVFSSVAHEMNHLDHVHEPTSLQ